MTEPAIHPTAGGRGPDTDALAAAQRPHQHTATVTTVSEYTQTGPRTARDVLGFAAQVAGGLVFIGLVYALMWLVAA